MLVIDKQNKTKLDISNDAFSYLYFGEEPLDEESWQEIKQLMAIYPHGYEIIGDYEYLPEGRVTFVAAPYVENEAKYDATYSLSKYIELQIKYLDNYQVRCWHYNSAKDIRELRGDFPIKVNPYGYEYFETHSGQCTFYLKDFIKVK